MSRYLVIATLVLALLFGGLAWWQSERAEALTTELDQAKSELIQKDIQIQQHKDAEAIFNSRLAEVRRESLELEAELSTLQNMEGRDAPLSDLLRATSAAIDRLRF